MLYTESLILPNSLSINYVIYILVHFKVKISAVLDFEYLNQQ